VKKFTRKVPGGTALPCPKCEEAYFHPLRSVPSGVHCEGSLRRANFLAAAGEFLTSHGKLHPLVGSADLNGLRLADLNTDY